MWSHAAWQGRHLPNPLPQRERLRAYSTYCNAVEGNTTFYATPTPDTVRSWAAQTAPDFRFLLKLPKAATHERRLSNVEEPVRAFLNVIEPLGSRVHALWVQLPPTFGPGDLDALATFLHRMPRTYRYAVEVRHSAFFETHQWEENLIGLLNDFGAEWVNIDTTTMFASAPTTDAEREAWTRKPRLPRRAHALTPHPVVRFIGRDDEALTIAGWQPWLEVVARWLREGRSPTVFVHTPDNVDAPALARRFHREVRGHVPDLEPLPEPIPAGPPTLF
jgi:uncharacterized protein YecE (DUF72 family)